MDDIRVSKDESSTVESNVEVDEDRGSEILSELLCSMDSAKGKGAGRGTPGSQTNWIVLTVDPDPFDA